MLIRWFFRTLFFVKFSFNNYFFVKFSFNNYFLLNLVLTKFLLKSIFNIYLLKVEKRSKNAKMAF